MMDFDSWRARSPYYGETHEALAQSVRRFVAQEIAPHIDRWEAEASFLSCQEGGTSRHSGAALPQSLWRAQWGFDIFHGMTQTEELSAVGAGGLTASLMTHGIGLPPILAMGAEEMKRRVAVPVLAGEKDHCARHYRTVGRFGREPTSGPRQSGSAIIMSSMVRRCSSPPACRLADPVRCARAGRGQAACRFCSSIWKRPASRARGSTRWAGAVRIRRRSISRM